MPLISMRKRLVTIKDEMSSPPASSVAYLIRENVSSGMIVLVLVA